MNRFLAIAKRHAQPLKRVGAMLLVAWVLLLGVLQFSPVAHKYVHSDADTAEHECAVTVFAHGVDGAVVELALAVVGWRLVARTAGQCAVFVPRPAFSHLPGRAPPVC